MTTSTTITEQVALVTGIGTEAADAVALALAKYGADVVVAYHANERRAAAIVEAITALGRRCMPVAFDLLHPISIQQMVDQTVQAFGRLDILVNGACVSIRKSLMEITEADWNQTLDINLKGIFYCSRCAAQAMIAHGTEGRIINISSVGRELEVFALDEVRDLANTDNLILYETSCGGINALTKNLAIELAQHSITVNAIALAREDNEQIHDDGVSMGGYLLEWDPSPRNIGHIVAYLTSARANYITGSIMLAKVEGLDAVEEILAGNDIP